MPGSLENDEPLISLAGFALTHVEGDDPVVPSFPSIFLFLCPLRPFAASLRSSTS